MGTTTGSVEVEVGSMGVCSRSGCLQSGSGCAMCDRTFVFICAAKAGLTVCAVLANFQICLCHVNILKNQKTTSMFWAYIASNHFF